MTDFGSGCLGVGFVPGSGGGGGGDVSLPSVPWDTSSQAFEDVFAEIEDLDGLRFIDIDASGTNGDADISVAQSFDMTGVFFRHAGRATGSAPQGLVNVRITVPGCELINPGWLDVSFTNLGDAGAVKYTNIAYAQWMNFRVAVGGAANAPALRFEHTGTKNVAFEGGIMTIGDANGYGVIEVAAGAMLVLVLDASSGTLYDNEITGAGFAFIGKGEGLAPDEGDTQPIINFDIPIANAARVDFDDTIAMTGSSKAQGAIEAVATALRPSVINYGSGNQLYVQGEASTTFRQVTTMDWDGSLAGLSKIVANLWGSAGGTGPTEVVIMDIDTADVYWAGVQAPTQALDAVVSLNQALLIPESVRRIGVMIRKQSGGGRPRMGSMTLYSFPRYP